MVAGHSKTQIARRIQTFGTLCWGAILVLILVYGWVQIIKRDEMRDLAQRQAVKNRITPAPRGVIYDRNGHKLVDNRRALNLVIQAEDLPKDPAQVEALARALDRDPQELKRRISLSRQASGNRLLNLLENLDDSGLAQAELLRARFPFLSIQAVPRRVYLGEDLAGHALGYVGEVDEKLMNKNPGQYRLGEIIGRTGIEATHNADIRGVDGERRILVDHLGREIAVRGVQESEAGKSIYLTLDAGLQQILQDAFGSENGAAVAIDLRDGGILAMYSSPGMDPNLFLNRLNQEQVDYFWRNPVKPMLNRATQGLYPPGSTFKPLMALAGLEKGVITPQTTFHCAGSKAFYGRPYKCEHVHGGVSVIRSIAESCNIFYYEVGSRLDVDDIYAAASKYGLIGKTGVDLPSESNSRVPNRAWKSLVGNTPDGKKWYAGETISVAIGQGDTAITPLSLARFYGAIATGGKLLTPHFLYGFRDEASGHLKQLQPPPAKDTGMKPEHRALLDEGLYLVVQAGTAQSLKSPDYEICGKTGTAQVRTHGGSAKGEKKSRTHALFAGYAPRNNPQIAFAVVAENAGYGGAAAAPIAKKLCQYWLVDRMKTPMPPPGVKALEEKEVQP